MKQFLYTTLAALLLVGTAACTEAETSFRPKGDGGKPTEEGAPLGVKSLGLSVEVESRSIATGGPAGGATNPNPLREVGLCVTNTSSGRLYAAGSHAQLFAYNADALPPAWQPAEGVEPLYLYTERGTVYGYAPTGGSVTVAGTPRMPLLGGVKVLDKQKFVFADGDMPADAATDAQWQTDQEDYLYATAPTEVDRWNPVVSLTMRHALAKVSFRISETGEGMELGNARVAKVELKSNGGFKRCSSGKLNLATGDLGGTTYDVALLAFAADGDMRPVATGATEARQVPVQAFGLVIPVEGVQATLELTLDDGRVFTMSPADDGTDTPGTFGVDWVKGNNYIYNIGMHQQGLRIADVEVAGWAEGGETDVPVE